MKARVTSSIVLAGAIAVGVSGCNFLAPQATTKIYDPSDGLGASLGSLSVENAIVISDDGETGNLVTTLVNTGESGESVTIQYEGTSGRVSQQFVVPAENRIELGGPDDPYFLMRGIDTQPGGLLPVYFQYGDEEGAEITVPVLTSDLPEYADYAPRDRVLDGFADTESTATPTPSPSATAEPEAPNAEDQPEG